MHDDVLTFTQALRSDGQYQNISQLVPSFPIVYSMNLHGSYRVVRVYLTRVSGGMVLYGRCRQLGLAVVTADSCSQQ